MNPLHQDLVKILIELYTLQIQLGNIAASSLQVPDSANAVFNRDAALAAGYTEEAVRFMAYMPYLSSEEDGFEIFPNTFVERYVEEPDEDVYAYQALRELDTDPFEGVYIPPNYIKLTKHNVYGSIFLYDTDTGLVRDWRPFDDDIDKHNQNFQVLPAKTPAETFGPWIDSYRKLKIFKYTDILMCWEPDEPITFPDPVVALKREKRRLAELKIRDFYLDNGWNVDAKEQDGFNLERFVEQRDAYREEVLYPLFDDEGSPETEA